MRPRIVFSVIALFSAVAQPAVQAQEPGSLPKAETVIEQFIEASGGKAVFEKFKNCTQMGTVEIPGAGITGKIQVYQAAPNQMAVMMDVGPAGKTIEATDGKDVWEVSPITGERLLEGVEKEDFLRDARFNDDLYVKELWAKVECVAVEDVEGKPAYKLAFTGKTGKTVLKFYDKTSHLLVKEVATAKSPMGEITVETFPSDYKKVDGQLVPFKATQKLLGQQLIVTLTEVKHDAEIPPDTFKRPKSLDPAPKKDEEKKKAD